MFISISGGHTVGAAARIAIAAAVCLFAGVDVSTYVGPSFVQIPGTDGGWKGAPYTNWFKIDAHYWPTAAIGLGGSMRRFGFSGPRSPRQGAGSLVIAIDKTSPVLAPMMDRCLNKTPTPELSFAEAADRGRNSFEIGARPTTVPEYFEYRLKDVTFGDCVVVPDAPQQAIVVSFRAIERLNYSLKEDGTDSLFVPKPIAPAASDAGTKSFVLTWFALAHDVADDQCPAMNQKPTEDDYYRFMSKEAADAERVERAGKGGVNYENGQMGLRGPNKLNVTMTPGIVRDPGNPEPRTTIARGLNLDRDDGGGAAPAGVCKHQNFSAADGRTGIDNQLYRVQGCIGSFQGHKGFFMQFSNTQMRDGALSMLMQITGIDHDKNDDSVDVTLFTSLDPMVKNAAGNQALPDFTYRLTDNPSYTHYFTRLHGRIENGVVITDPVDELQMNLGQYGTPVHLRMFQAGIRVALEAGGTIKGVLGGYQDWRVIASRYTSSASEQVHNFQVPGLYNSLRRNADGLKDPITNECNGISSAYDIEGIPAYIEPPAVKATP